MKHAPLDALPEGFYEPFRVYAEKMLADGWTLNHGPWSTGYADGEVHVSDGDRSVVLTRDDFVVWFVDRDQKNKWRGAWTERWTAAWRKDGLAAIPKEYWPAEYSWNAWQNAAGKCHYCHEVKETKSIGFAGRICADCDADGTIRAKVEFPGWYN